MSDDLDDLMCPRVLIGNRPANDRACALPVGHLGNHEFTVKPTPEGEWEDKPGSSATAARGEES